MECCRAGTCYWGQCVARHNQGGYDASLQKDTSDVGFAPQIQSLSGPRLTFNPPKAPFDMLPKYFLNGSSDENQKQTEATATVTTATTGSMYRTIEPFPKLVATSEMLMRRQGIANPYEQYLSRVPAKLTIPGDLGTLPEQWAPSPRGENTDRDYLRLRRNAGASARFRQRRKEKEKEYLERVEGDESNLSDAEHRRLRYRIEARTFRERRLAYVTRLQREARQFDETVNAIVKQIRHRIAQLEKEIRGELSGGT